MEIYYGILINNDIEARGSSWGCTGINLSNMDDLQAGQLKVFFYGDRIPNKPCNAGIVYAIAGAYGVTFPIQIGFDYDQNKVYYRVRNSSGDFNAWSTII